jgi:hypothetical protein
MRSASPSPDGLLRRQRSERFLQQMLLRYFQGQQLTRLGSGRLSSISVAASAAPAEDVWSAAQPAAAISRRFKPYFLLAEASVVTPSEQADSPAMRQTHRSIYLCAAASRMGAALSGWCQVTGNPSTLAILNPGTGLQARACWVVPSAPPLDNRGVTVSGHSE